MKDRITKRSKRSRRKVKYLKSVDEIPEFKNIEEEIEFWETHSIIDIIDQFPEVKLKIGGELKKSEKAVCVEQDINTLQERADIQMLGSDEVQRFFHSAAAELQPILELYFPNRTTE